MTDLATEYILGPLARIPIGEGRVFDVNGRRIAIFHARSGAVYATQARCPHRGGPLADGLMGGSSVVCPLHAWRFDLISGAALFGDCGITTYPARLDERGDVIVALGDSEEQHTIQ